MKKEFKDILNNGHIGIYVHCENSGMDDDADASEFGNVDYYIRDGKIYDWMNDEICDLDDIEITNEEEWFKDFTEQLILFVLAEGGVGYDTLEEFKENNYALLALLNDADNFNDIDEAEIGTDIWED